MLGELLETLGHDVRVAHNGLTALAIARDYVPDVVLLDIGLPIMDGYQVAQRPRRDPSLDHVQLIALTGYGQPEDRRRSREAGFDHHLAKPVHPCALQAALDGVRS